MPTPLFQPWGIGFADFGTDPETVLGLAEILWGPPSGDTGWMPTSSGSLGVCPGTQVRQVMFLGDTLTLMFSDVEAFVPGTAPKFVWYGYYSPAMTRLTAGPPDSIDLGVTVAEMLAIWPTMNIESDDPLFGDAFWIRPDAGFQYLGGTLTGTSGADTIEYVNGGYGCGE